MVYLDGPQYAETEDLPLRAVTQRMRADVKALKAEGVVPAALEVRIAVVETTTIEITVLGLRDAATWRPNSGKAPADLLASARRIYDALVDVHRAYNRRVATGPVRYGGQVRMLSEADQQQLEIHRQHQAARARRRREARAAEQNTRWRAEVATEVPLSIAVVDKDTTTIVQRIAGANVGGRLSQRVRDALTAEGWTVVYAHPRARNRGPWWSITRTDAPPSLAPATPPGAPISSHTPRKEHVNDQPYSL